MPGWGTSGRLTSGCSDGPKSTGRAARQISSRPAKLCVDQVLMGLFAGPVSLHGPRSGIAFRGYLLLFVWHRDSSHDGHNGNHEEHEGQHPRQRGKESNCIAGTRCASPDCEYGRRRSEAAYRLKRWRFGRSPRMRAEDHSPGRKPREWSRKQSEAAARAKEINQRRQRSLPVIGRRASACAISLGRWRTPDAPRLAS